MDSSSARPVKFIAWRSIFAMRRDPPRLMPDQGVANFRSTNSYQLGSLFSANH
jgi:hypothetical protein